MSKINLKKYKIPSPILEIIKWGVISFIALLISYYILSKLLISNTLLLTLSIALIISIIILAVKNHSHRFSFNMRWFIFYFLVYSIIIWFAEQYLLPMFSVKNVFLSSAIIGFIISFVMFLIKKSNLKSRTVPWISLILVLVLLVSNLSSLENISPIKLPNSYQNSGELSESEQTCPTPTEVLQEWETVFNSESIASALNNLIDTSVWRVENLFSSCYKGKYSGQHPDRFYCDNMIVSRWETSSSGAINYRWYTAVTAEFTPQKLSNGVIYSLSDFSCENGQKVVVKKGVTDYYVYDSRDGSTIRIQY